MDGFLWTMARLEGVDFQFISDPEAGQSDREHAKNFKSISGAL
jgi:hypothetical protein